MTNMVSTYSDLCGRKVKIPIICKVVVFGAYVYRAP